MAAVVCHEIGHVVSRDVWSTINALVAISDGKVDLRKLRHPEGKRVLEKIVVHGTANEKAADAWAIRCLAKNGYSPKALLQLLQTILREAQYPESGLIATKEWRLHMEERVAHAKRLLKARHDPSGSLKRTEYLRRIVGLVVGRDPRDGIRVGQRFVHVRSGLEFRIPTGWVHSTLGRGTTLRSPKGDLVLLSENSAGSTKKLWERLKTQKQVIEGPRGGTWIGRPALDGIIGSLPGSGKRLIAFEQAGRVYSLVAYSHGEGPYDPTAVAPVLNSAKPFSGPLLPVMRPWVIRLIRLPKGLDSDEFSVGVTVGLAHDRLPRLSTCLLLS